MGRLFDAVSARLGFGKENGYEGECAVSLEHAAECAGEAGVSPVFLEFPIKAQAGMLQIGQTELFAQIGRLADEGADPGALALGFHQAAAKMVLDVCRHIRAETGENRVALCGGVFLNRLLLADCQDRLRRDGFAVYRNEQMPPGDGALAYGQAYIGAIKQRKGGW